MKRICVDTEVLKQKADDLETMAGAIAGIGNGIMQTAKRLPGYAGQLSKPALSAGYDAQRQTREEVDLLAAGAESLRNTARAFEEMDQQAIASFAEGQALLSGMLAEFSMPAAGGGFIPADDMALGDRGGSANFGYQKVGTRYIYLFYQGTTIVIDLTAVDPETAGQVFSFIEAVDGWDSILSELSVEDANSLMAVLQGFFFGAGALVSTPLTSILGAIAAGGAWGKTIVDAGKWTEEFEEDWNALWETRSKAAGIFSWLGSSGKDGILSRPTTREETNLFA